MPEQRVTGYLYLNIKAINCGGFLERGCWVLIPMAQRGAECPAGPNRD